MKASLSETLSLWRIVPGNDAVRAMSGSGGMTNNGRWHTRGRLIVYLATIPSLAILEILVNTTSEQLSTRNYHLMEVILPWGSTEVFDLTRLPQGWNNPDRGQATADLGNAWIDQREHVALRVPSAAVPLKVQALEHNYLINPLHPRWTERQVTQVLPLPFARRLK